MSPVKTGFLVTSIFHGGILLAVFFNMSVNVFSESSAQVFPVTLDMFISQIEERQDVVSEVMEHKVPAEVKPRDIPESIPEKNKITTKKKLEKIKKNSQLISKPLIVKPVMQQIAQVLKPIKSEKDIDRINLIESQYAAALNRAIEARKYYPSRAKRMAHEGSVVVGFDINSEGDINNIRVVRSSSIRILDKAAVNAIVKIGRFEPIPSILDRDWWNFEITLKYYLL